MIYNIENEAQWHALRLKHIGGSEVAALFSECSYMTRLELWLTKRGDIPANFEDTERMFWGRMVEDAIAQGVSKRTGWHCENPKAYYTADDVHGMGCTPDRIIMYDPRGTGLLQIKNTDRLMYMKWDDGQPPLMYQLQLQHEMACVGVSWGCLAVLVGGNELKMFEYEAHQGAISRIKTEINKFWQSIADNNPPSAVAEDYDLIKNMYESIGDTVIDLSGDNEFPMMCAQAVEAGEKRKAAEKEEKTAKAVIAQKIGEYSRALCDGFTVKKTTVCKDAYMVKAQKYNMLNIKQKELLA